MSDPIDDTDDAESRTVNDDESRALIRVAIEKHLGTAPPACAPSASAFVPATADKSAGKPDPSVVSLSFGRYTLPRADDDTQCLIEPSSNEDAGLHLNS